MSVTDLVGVTVNVLRGGVPIRTGVVPQLPSMMSCDGDGEDMKSRTDFPNGGHVEIEIKDDGRERLKVEVEGNDLMLGDMLTIQFVDQFGVELGAPNNFFPVTVEMDVDDGEIEADFHLRPQERMDTLPGGVISVADLVGVTVNVFRGISPSPGDQPIRTATVPALFLE